MELTVPKPVARRYTVEEYFKLAESSPTKLEYRDGEIIDMAGGRFEHNQIATNISGSLWGRLLGSPCQPINSDQRSRAADHRYCYPDVTIVCGQPQFDPADTSRMTLLNPQVLFEVLSPSTEATDRSEKLVRYINLRSMREYFLVAQDKARVESFVREADGSWSVGPVSEGLDSSVAVPSLGVAIPMQEIYANVKFEN
jgi:Uma2 family endonuclease